VTHQKNKQINIIEDDIFARIDEAIEQARFVPDFTLYLQTFIDQTLMNNKKDSMHELLSLRRRRKLEIFYREIKGLKQHLKSMSVDSGKIRVEITHVINT
jgi:hypothetical protein